jgi:hypothetical protein
MRSMNVVRRQVTEEEQFFCVSYHFCEDGSIKCEAKAIPVTGRRGPYGCKTSRLPHFIDNRLTDGGEVSPTRWLPFTPRKNSGTHFCSTLSRPQGHSAAGKVRSIEKSSDIIGNHTRDFPTCSVVPQPTTLPHVSCKE